MTSNKRKRCWLYARVANEMLLPSGEGGETDAQLNRLKQYASDRGWEIAGETREQGVSGNARGRLGLASLMKIVRLRPKPFDILLIESRSRLSRDQVALAGIIRNLEQAGIEVRTTDASFPDTRVPLLDRSFLIFEDYRRMREAESLRNRRLTAARNGLWQTRAPFGYIRVPKSSGGYTLAVYESEAKVVRHAFCLAFDHEKGLSGISRALNKGGHCTRDGKAWRVSAVKKILENPIYMGLARIWTPLDTKNIAESITGIRIPVPRIVSRQLFFSVQRILRDRSPSRGRAEDVKRRISKRRNH